MVFSGLRTRNTLRDLMVLISRPLLFLYRNTQRQHLLMSHFCLFLFEELGFFSPLTHCHYMYNMFY